MTASLLKQASHSRKAKPANVALFVSIVFKCFGKVKPDYVFVELDKDRAEKMRKQGNKPKDFFSVISDAVRGNTGDFWEGTFEIIENKKVKEDIKLKMFTQ